MIALLNFNTYLGGGETLLVRLAEYLQQSGQDFLLFYKSNSYISADLKKKSIDGRHCIEIDMRTDYYYLSESERDHLRRTILGHLHGDNYYELYSFCARDLYLTVDLTKYCSGNLKLIHLVLHDQDNLYCCQSLYDKFKLIAFGKRSFSDKKMLEFNKALFNQVCEHGVVIPQSDLVTRLWSEQYNINLDFKEVVPLPTCSFSNYSFNIDNNKKILWIGRIVDFKIPAICAMLDFLKKRPDYSLSIVGYGHESFVENYMMKHGVNKDQVSFLGKVNYDELKTVIQSHSIGYAMGTSIVEIAQYGLPVIMALASPDYKLFNNDVCGGLYVNKSKGNVGVDLFYKNSLDGFPSIADTVSDIENNFSECAIKSYDCIKSMFDFEKNASMYFSIPQCCGTYHKYDIYIRKASPLRVLAYKVVNYFKK